MKKILGTAVILIGSLLLVAADKRVVTRSATGVYDANGRFIGTLVDSTVTPTVYVPSLKKLIQFDVLGDILWADLAFTSSDCSGTAYANPGVLGPTTVRRYGSGLYTVARAGDPVTTALITNSVYLNGECSPYITMVTGNVPVTLTPLNEPLPFAVPLAQPLTLK